MESSFYDGGKLLLEPTDNPFKVFVPSIYNKGQWTVHMLRGVVGDKIFFQSLKEYAQDSRFKHGFATTEDLQGVFEKNHKAPLKDFFQQWVYGEMFPVYTTNYTQDKKTKDISFRLDQQKQTTAPNFFTMPIEIALIFEDGTTKTERVENNALSQTLTFKTDKVLKSAKLDANEWVLKQVNSETYNKGTKKAFQLQSITATEKQTVFALLSPKKQTVVMTISDLTGKVLLQINLEKIKGTHEEKLNLTLKPGRYNVQFIGDDTHILRQITVVRTR